MFILMDVVLLLRMKILMNLVVLLRRFVWWIGVWVLGIVDVVALVWSRLLLIRMIELGVLLCLLYGRLVRLMKLIIVKVCGWCG